MPSILSPSALMTIAPIRSSFMRWITEVMDDSGRMVTTRPLLDFRMLATVMGRLSAHRRGHRRGTRAPPRRGGTIALEPPGRKRRCVEKAGLNAQGNWTKVPLRPAGVFVDSSAPIEARHPIAAE